MVVDTVCLTVVQAIRCSSVNLSYLGRVVDECKILVNELKNRHVTLNFVKRSVNKLADFLARRNSSIVVSGMVVILIHRVLHIYLKF